MNEVSVTKWWWVRHAPVVDAHLHCLSGQSDVAADVSDTASFRALAARLPRNAVWLVTNLKRTVQTAEALWAAGAERAELLVEPALTEQAFGDWTGRTWDEVGADHAFWDAPEATVPPGKPSESFAEVCARVAMRTNELTAAFAGRDVVCVAHAGTIRAAVALALGLTPSQALALEVGNTSLTRLDNIGGANWRVVGLNQFC